MRKLSIFIFGISILISCDQNRVFDSYVDINKKGWHKDSIIQMTFPELDSLKKYHLFFNIRNTNEYPFSNLYLITQLNCPNGKQIIDTLEYEMATPSGKWLGVGASSIKESKLWYQDNFQFKEKGTYSIQIKQAMRTNGSVDGLLYLKGITNVGFRIEKTLEKP